MRDLYVLTPDEPHPEGISAGTGDERVLLLTLTSGDAQRDQRDLAELEGLVRSAGAEPVARTSQRGGQTNPQTLWGSGKLQEAALEIRRCQASLVITDRELTPCLLYTSPSPRDATLSRMPSSA